MTPGDSFYLYSIGTVSSAGLERCLDRAEVAGSNPATSSKTLGIAMISRVFSCFHQNFRPPAFPT